MITQNFTTGPDPRLDEIYFLSRREDQSAQAGEIQQDKEETSGSNAKHMLDIITPIIKI